MPLPSSMYRNSSVRVPSSIRSNTNNSVTVPHSAPVLDYSCLFSHDLKRKQKRWQDGKLKFHTFNKRIMVYDERGNFIGDTHWQEDHDFDEGEEFQLERGCVIVQVNECVGSKEQDLSELIDKRYQDKEQRQARAAAAAAATPARQIQRPPPPGAQQRPLSDLTTTPRGNVIGRAVIPTKSPFEQRQEEAQARDEESPRPTKRRKPLVSPPSKSGYAQSLFGASLSLSWSASSQPSQAVRVQVPSETEVEYSAKPPPSRPRPVPSLLRSIPRDVPLVPTERRKSPPRRTREPSPEETVRQQQKPARSLTATKATAASRKLHSTGTRHIRDIELEEKDDGTDSDVVEIAPPPTKAAPRKKAPKEKEKIAQKDSNTKTAAKRNETSTRQRNSRAASPKNPPPQHTAPLPTEGDDDQDRSLVISRPRPSRKRRLLMVADSAGPPKRRHGGDNTAGANRLPHVRVIPLVPSTTEPAPVPDAGNDSSDERGAPSPPQSVQPSRPVDESSAGPDFGQESPTGRRPPSDFIAQSEVSSPEALVEAQLSPSIAASSPHQPDQMEADEMFDHASRSPDISDESDAPVRTRRRLRKKRTSTNTSSNDDVRREDEEEDEGEEEDNDYDEAPKVTRKIPARNLWLEQQFPFLPRGARLATLRRSVKSKEILGYVQEEEYQSPPRISSAESSPRSSPVESPDDQDLASDETKDDAAGSNDVVLSNMRQDSAPIERPQAGSAGASPDKAPESPEPEPELESIPLFTADAPEPSPPSPEEADVDTLPHQPPAPPVLVDAVATTDAAPAPSFEACAREAISIASVPPQVTEEKARVPISKTIVPLSARPQVRRPVRLLTSAQTTIARTWTSESNHSAGSAVSEDAASAVPAGPATAKPNNPPFQAQRPRIANPATRGRKAALSSDAAGQLPQTIVPAALPPPPVMCPPRRNAPREAQKETSNSNAVILPGFTSAGGGPWSKTAHDLLGIERPTT